MSAAIEMHAVDKAFRRQRVLAWVYTFAFEWYSHTTDGSAGSLDRLIAAPTLCRYGVCTKPLSALPTLNINSKFAVIDSLSKYRDM